MKKAYLLIFNMASGRNMDAVKTWANASNVVDTWRYDLPNTFYLISENTASEISEDYMRHFGRVGRHIVVEVTDNRQGLLPKETWHLLRHKEHLKK